MNETALIYPKNPSKKKKQSNKTEHMSSDSSSHGGHSDFLDRWLERQQVFLDKIKDISVDEEDDENKRELVKQVILHYEEYYEEKYKVINEDIFQLFSPPWLTFFEKAFLWLGGMFKPSLPLCMAEITVGKGDMAAEQAEKLGAVKDEVVWMEKKLMDGLAKVQESIGSRQLTELTKKWRKLVDGQVGEFEDAIVKLKEELGKIVEEADNLRRFAVAKTVQILSVDQTLKLLAALAQYQLRIRAWGVKNDHDIKRETYKQRDFRDF